MERLPSSRELPEVRHCGDAAVNPIVALPAGGASRVRARPVPAPTPAHQPALQPAPTRAPPWAAPPAFSAPPTPWALRRVPKTQLLDPPGREPGGAFC